MKSNREWRYWGRVDPLWSVASWPGKDTTGKSPWTPEEFLALGESDFGDVLRHWEHYGLLPDACVEIGCGAGRMTAQLALAFESVVALDVSSDQIATAQRMLGVRGKNVRFVQVDASTIPLPDASCSAMFSSHVFQHFAGYRGVVEYLTETRRVLRTGGTFCFHVPVPGAHRLGTSSLRLSTRNLALQVMRLLGARRIMEYHRYAPELVFRTLEEIGFKDLELRIFDMKSNRDAHSYFFGRRT